MGKTNMKPNALDAALSERSQWSETENGAPVRTTTGDKIVDLFGKIGAMRVTPEDAIRKTFFDAYEENPDLATKMIFYARNCRGGLGEKNTPKVILTALTIEEPGLVAANLKNIPVYGTWKDLYWFVGTPVEKQAFALMKEQFNEDLALLGDNKPVSLLGKWLASESASSKQTKRLAAMTRHYFGLSAEEYRKKVSALRKAIHVVETQMSAREWDKIDYEKVPAVAMKNYHTAFDNHDTDRYQEYLADVKAGKKEVKASVLYPYDLVHDYLKYSYTAHIDRYPEDPAIEAQWKALPNFLGETKDGDSNIMIMCDTSGSMNGRPLETAVGLAIYFAQRNHGAFAGKFMTFARRPKYVDISGCSSLKSCLSKVPWNICENTDIEAAFDLILDTAVDNKVPQKDMPRSLIIISDMQFDQAAYFVDRSEGSFKDYYTIMKEKFEKAGYTIPHIIFWDVDARDNDVYHARAGEEAVQFVSGSSASSFRKVITGTMLSSYQLVEETLSDKMYDKVVLPSELER